MNKIRNGLIRRWRFAGAWIHDGKPLWSWLMLAVILFGIPYMFPAPYFDISLNLSDRVRWSGMLFQFAGLCVVVWGLNRSRQLFERSSLWSAIGEWLGRVRLIVMPPKTVVVPAKGVSAGAAMASGSATVSLPTSGTSMEERVAKLEADVKWFEAKLSGIDRELQTLRTETTQRVQHEHTQRVADDRKISKQLEAATIGGIHLELAGLAYLFVGIAFTAVPQETAWLLRAIGF